MKKRKSFLNYTPKYKDGGTTSKPKKVIVNDDKGKPFTYQTLPMDSPKKFGWGGGIAGGAEGAMSGASTGAMFGPWGAAIGGVLGAGIGAYSGSKNEDVLNQQQKQMRMASMGYPSAYHNPSDPYGYFAEGGETSNPNTIEVEGKEFETQNGKILKDFKKQPTHEKGGYQYEAKPGRTIIPANLRKRYEEGDKTTRTTLEANVVKDQVEREATKMYGKGGLTKFLQYAKGGKTPSYGDGGGIGAGIKDVGMFAADTALAEWAPNAIKQNQYSDTELGKSLGKVSAVNESFSSQSPIAKNISSHWDDHNTGYDQSQQKLYNQVQPIAKVGSKIGEMYTAGAMRGGSAMGSQTGGAMMQDQSMSSTDKPMMKKGGRIFNRIPKAADGLFTNPNAPTIGNPGQTASYPGDPNDYMGGNLDSSLGQSNGFDWQGNGNKAMQLAPAAYNLVRGLQKPQVLNPETFQNPYEGRVKSLMANRNIDFQPVENEIRDTYKMGLSNIGNGAKSGGQVLSGASALWGSRMNALAKAKMNAQDANNGYRGEEAGTLASLGAQRARTNLGVQDMNDQNRAARNTFLGAAATDASKYAQGSNQDKIHENLLSQMFNNEEWDPKTKTYIYRSSKSLKNQ